jgi:hypothetical protein
MPTSEIVTTWNKYPCHEGHAAKDTIVLARKQFDIHNPFNK